MARSGTQHNAGPMNRMRLLPNTGARDSKRIVTVHRLVAISRCSRPGIALCPRYRRYRCSDGTADFAGDAGIVHAGYLARLGHSNRLGDSAVLDAFDPVAEFLETFDNLVVGRALHQDFVGSPLVVKAWPRDRLTE